MSNAYKHFRCLVLLGLIIAAGCSVHPLPADISRETTVSIVRNIRCEGKREVVSQVRNLLNSSKFTSINTIQPEQVLEKHNLRAIEKYEPVIVTKIYKYRSTVIGYAFDFEITENNRKGANANFQMPFSDGTFSVGLTGGAMKTRLGKRTFSMEETFEKLGSGSV